MSLTYEDSSEVEGTTGARNESSVLFSLGALSEFAKQERPRAAPAATQSDGSGLIDIRALAAALTPSAARTSVPTIDLVLSVRGPAAPLGSPLAAPVIAAAPRRGSSARTTALAGLAAVTALALAAVALAAVYRDSPSRAGPEPAREIALDVPAPPSAGPDLDVASAHIDEAPIVALEEEPSATGIAVPAAEPAPRVRSRLETRTAPAPRVAEDVAPTPAAPVAPARTTGLSLDELLRRAAPPVDGASTRGSTERLPETPSRADVRAAMNALAPAMRTCAAGGHGRALASVVVAGATGQARSASVGGDFGGAEADCMTRALRGVGLEPFSRSTFTIAYPFAL